MRESDVKTLGTGYFLQGMSAQLKNFQQCIFIFRDLKG